MTESKSPGAVCAAWWHQTFGNDDGAARMTRARLRRCATALEALSVEAVHDLNARLRDAGHYPTADRLALLATVLAHVSEHGSLRLATAFGRREHKDAPRVLSALRFQGLVGTTDPMELITPLRRAMAIVRASPIDIAALAADLYRWDQGVRTAWCFQYFGAPTAAPEHHPQELSA